MPLETAVTCATCDGDGAEPGHRARRPARAAAAAAALQQVSRSIFGEFVRQPTCPRLQRHAADRSSIRARPAAAPGGRSRSATLEVEIPAGIHDGQRIRITGEGHAGALGGRAGDVYVGVRVRPDERFVREGNDIFSQVDLTIVAGGARRDASPVETLDGPESSSSFDPGTQPGEVRVLRGKGMPVLQGFGHGDHRVLVNVIVPRRLTDEQRKLLEEFEQLERRAHLPATTRASSRS